MATVTLTAVWLNDAVDPSDAESFQNTIELGVTSTREASVRRLANGRLRLVLGAAAPHVAQLKFQLCTRAQVMWLEDHVGRVVCYRDDRGRKFYGAYTEAPVTENVTRVDYADVSITLDEVTFIEAV